MDAKKIAENLLKVIPMRCDREKRKPNKLEADLYTLAQAYLNLLEEKG